MSRPSIKSLALEFLVKNVGDVVRRADIEAYVRSVRSDITAGEVTRRIRDLRQDGWAVETNASNSELKPGQYRLQSLTKREPSPVKQRALGSLIAEVLSRADSDLREISDAIEVRLRRRN